MQKRKININILMCLCFLFGVVSVDVYAQQSTSLSRNFTSLNMQRFRAVDSQMPPLQQERPAHWAEYGSVSSGKNYIRGYRDVYNYSYKIMIDTNNNTIDVNNSDQRHAFVRLVPLEYVHFAPDERISETYKGIIYGSFVLSVTTNCANRTIRYHTAYFYPPFNFRRTIRYEVIAYARQDTNFHQARDRGEAQFIRYICP